MPAPTSSAFTAILGRVAGGEDLSAEEMQVAIESVMAGEVPVPQVALLLTSLSAKGETVEELVGAARVLRRHMTPLRSSRAGVVDTCGTGGDRSGTFNISTAAALVAAAAGVPVAKHGNRGFSSRCGSADVLLELGVNVLADPAWAARALEELGIAFCFAPLWHGSMKHVAAVRKQLGVPTIFNLIGPLANPAGAPYQVLGVARREVQPLLAEALMRLGIEHAVVVHGEDGLDEVTLAAETVVLEVTQSSIKQHRWQPEDFGVARGSLDALKVSGPAESAAIIRQVLSGVSGPARDIVVINAAAAIWTAGRAPGLAEAAEMARRAIDDRRAEVLLQRLALVAK